MVHGQRTGEVGDRALGRVIEAHAPVAAQTGHRRDVDDVAFAGDQCRHGGAGAIEHAVQVHGHQLFPVLYAQLGHFAGLDDAGIVDQHIQAPEAGRHFLEQRFHVARVGHIRGSDQVPFALQLRGYFGQLVVITADQHNTCAFLGKTFGGRFADSGTGTCDDDDFLGETIHSAVSKK